MATESVESLERRIEALPRMKSFPARELGTEDVPAARYTSEEYFRKEQAKVFRGPVWLLAGHERDLEVPGHYFTFESGLGGSIIVVRSGEGRVRAFHNQCAHRGSEIVPTGRGTLERFRCPYHLWTYDLDGKLCELRDEKQFFGLERHRYGLEPVPLETWAGFIWLSLDPEAPPLRDYLEELVEEFEPYGLERWVVIDRDSWTFPVNWKLIVDAFNEIYHIPQIHPQTVTPFLELEAGLMDTYGLHSRMTLPFKWRNSVLGVEKDEEIPVAIPELDAVRRNADMHYYVFPSVQFNLVVSYATMFAAYPLGVRETRFDYAFLGIPPLDGAALSYYEPLAAAFRVALDEDFANLERVQRGLDAQGKRAFPLNYQEVRIRHFHKVLGDWIGE